MRRNGLTFCLPLILGTVLLQPAYLRGDAGPQSIHSIGNMPFRLTCNNHFLQRLLAGRKPPPVPKDECGGFPYWGTVTEITKGSITIQFADTTPKRFPLSETLAAGKIPKDPRPLATTDYKYPVTAPYMYRLSDVRERDWVAIMCYTAGNGGAVICDHICIQKRPGGRVPRLPKEVEDMQRDPIRYDERINAYWDLEDKGIPYPAKFGKGRRFPIAPMPRSVPDQKPIQ